MHLGEQEVHKKNSEQQKKLIYSAHNQLQFAGN